MKIHAYWDNTDSMYIAEIPELPGCMVHGETYKEALKQAETAIQLWIDTAKEFDDPVPEPKGPKLIDA